MPTLPGIHHITAISASAQQNLNAYAGTLGLRLVKTTVNFDDPGTYHLYYGDRTGRPGTILTFFPWANAAPGQQGAGLAGATAFMAPAGSLDLWQKRLAAAGFGVEDRTERFGTEVLPAAAPDGLPIEIVATSETEQVDAAGTAEAWTGRDLDANHALRGFFGTTLPAINAPKTLELMTDIFGWTHEHESDDRIRLRAPQGDAPTPGAVVDLRKNPAQSAGRMGKGTVHHVAFRAEDDAQQTEWQEQLRRLGLQVTEVKDRQYFRSIYFRHPQWTSGVLFEIATDAPGFLHDEDEDELGTALKLPSRLEDRRDELEQRLPEINRP